MSAQFPLGIKQWLPTDETYPVDLKEIVYARHVTTIYDEVTAIQRELGAGGLRASTNYVAAYNATPAVVWTSLKSRLENIEQGAFDGATKRVSIAGGSVITAGSASTIGVAIRAASSQTANLLEFRNSGGTSSQGFDKDGLFYGVIDGGNA